MANAPEDFGPVEKAQLRKFIHDTEDAERQMKNLDRQEAFKKLPLRKKLPVYFTKGIGLVIGIAFVIILILGMAGGL